jgi:hypothetical protein
MNQFIEPLKEAGRVFVLAIIPLLIDSLGKQQIDWIAILIVGVIAVLRFLDKYLHNQAPTGMAGGLTQF